MPVHHVYVNVVTPLDAPRHSGTLQGASLHRRDVRGSKKTMVYLDA
jgi:hypothetical protein